MGGQKSLALPNDEAAENILVRLRAGQQTREEAFEGIFRLFYPTVFGWFRRWGCSIEESEELTQETFFRLYTYIEGFRGERSFRIYLSRIAKRVLIHKIRERSAQKRHPGFIESISQLEEVQEKEVSEPSYPPVQEERVLGAEAAALLRKAVSELPRQQRRCVLLRYFGGLPEQDVAEVLKLAQGTVKANLSQARAVLRERLGPILVERWFSSPGPDVK